MTIIYLFASVIRLMYKAEIVIALLILVALVHNYAHTGVFFP